jgi:hypothetical protein
MANKCYIRTSTWNTFETRSLYGNKIWILIKCDETELKAREKKTLRKTYNWLAPWSWALIDKLAVVQRLIYT